MNPSAPRQRRIHSTMSVISPSPPPPSYTSLLLATISANFGGLLVGIHLSVFSGILEMPSFNDSFNPTLGIKSMITSALIVGAIICSFPAGPLCDRLGRRNALLLTSLLFFLATLRMATAQSVLHLVLARILAGAAYAVANIVCPMYSAEVSPPAIRAIIVNFYQLLITVGILFAQLLNWQYWNTPPWSLPLSYSLIPAALMTLLVFIFTPESPAWLQAQGRGPEAISAAHRLGISPPTSGEEQAEEKTEKGASIGAMLADASARQRLIIGAGIGAAQQLSGINAVIFYGPALVGDVLGTSGSSGPFQAAAMVGLANFLASLVSMGLIERFGRRQLLLGASLPMMAALTTLGMMRDGIIDKSGGVGVGALLIFVGAFAVTYGPLAFVIASEVFPVQYKGAGMGVCGFVVMGCAGAIGVGFLKALEAWGGGVFFGFTICMAGSSLFIWKCLPETRGLSLEMIDELLRDKDGHERTQDV